MDKQRAKTAIIAEYLSGGTSTRKLGIKYGYSQMTISRWIMADKKHGKQQSIALLKDTLRSKEAASMPTDIKELQQALRLSRIKVELLETMIDISDEEFGTNIRKKAGTVQS
jgi:transposase-like protein